MRALVVSVVPTLAFLIRPDIARATDWELPSLSQSVADSDAVAIVKIVNVLPAPARAEGGRRLSVWVEVREWLKGAGADRILLGELDAGDPKGHDSPLPPLPERLVGAEVLVCMSGPKNVDGHAMYVARTRFLIEKDRVRNLVLQDMPDQNLSLGMLRRTIAELSLIQSAISADPNGDGAIAACRTGLCSSQEEVVWYSARELLRGQRISRALAPAIQNALGRAKPGSPVHQVLAQCLARVTGKP